MGRLTNALYDFSNANGATRTHTNTNGTASNTSSGTPPAGGWLATAANPTSDNLWTSLQILTALPSERARPAHGCSPQPYF